MSFYSKLEGAMKLKFAPFCTPSDMLLPGYPFLRKSKFSDFCRKQWTANVEKVLVVFASGDSDRDVFNEKPSKEEQMAATQVSLGEYWAVCVCVGWVWVCVWGGVCVCVHVCMCACACVWGVCGVCVSASPSPSLPGWWGIKGQQHCHTPHLPGRHTDQALP